MSEIKIDPRKQFSKRLARWTSFFWFVYMTWLSALIMIVPQAALYCVYLAIIATSVMLLNVWTYTRNSIYEKGVFAMLDKTKLSLNLSSYNPGINVSPSESSEDVSEDDSGEGCDNG
jgi:hypothetical protein